MRRRRLVLAVAFGSLVLVGVAARQWLVAGGGVTSQFDGSPTQTSPNLSPISLPRRSPVKAERVVVIHKAERVLGLYLAGKLAATYSIGLGPHAEGHKQTEGDGRTPEGSYYICNRNPRSPFHLFLGISYPNADDANAARRTGRITEKQRRAIVMAIAARRQPPWDTPLGGEVGIHGGGAGSDWTLGCIALENEAVEHLWRVLRMGDPVIIRWSGARH